MNNKVIVKTAGFTALLGLTALSVTLYPWLKSVHATQIANVDPVQVQTLQTQQEKPLVEVVFVLDTTGSMGGLIQTAKEKIWSIASSMAAADPAPDIKIGLVAYRDRGDAYVTQVTDLSSDLDSVYATLMQYQAEGGGDGPESVNQALFDAVNKISWSGGDNVYKSIFLVGDAPPHMDYNEVKYPQTLKVANNKHIVVNAIQCGESHDTAQQWQQIAQLSQGKFFNVAQSGGGIAVETPFDREIADLSRKLEGTKLYFGDEKDRAKQSRKSAAVDKVFSEASAPSIARRAAFNATDSGSKNFTGDKDLIATVVSGDRVRSEELKKIPEAHLPEPVKELPEEEREAYVEAKAKERLDLNRQIRKLSEQRQQFIEEKVTASGEGETSLDDQIYSVIKEQGKKAGINYVGESAAY